MGFVATSFPVQRGKHKFEKIESEEEFEQKIIKVGQANNALLKEGLQKKSSKKVFLAEQPFENLEMAFVEFWAPFAESCRYV